MIFPYNREEETLLSLIPNNRIFHVMSIPIVFEYDYKMSVETNLDTDRFEAHFKKMINSVKRSSVPHLEVTFSSSKEIGDIRSEMEMMVDFNSRSFIYETLDYEDEYTGEKYFTFFDKQDKTLQCVNCNDLNPAKIPRGERLPCCDECLCACSEYTHKGEDAPIEKMRIVNSGGTDFRVCEDCIPTFTSS